VKILKDTTFKTGLNHSYLVNDTKSKVLAYRKENTDEITVFSKPLPFSPSKREMKVIDDRSLLEIVNDK